MASIARIGIAKVGYNNLTRQLCKVTTTSNVMQLAFISNKAKRVNQRRLAPFDYFNKKYGGFWNQLFDPMVYRFDENTKVIVIEGPVAAGKSKVAAKVAEELEMVYLPPVSFDDIYLTEYGYDLRTLDDRLSPSAQSCDIEKFLRNPHHPNVPAFQFHHFQLKYDQYLTALLHLLSTGQGVVLNRSFFTDYIFAKAMTNAGYMRPAALKYYTEVVNMAMEAVMRPHLIIYLDVPVDAVKEKIKKRGIPYEVNSKVLTSNYLQDIENIYKFDYLKNIATHSHVLVYDWTDEGDFTSLIEDIETLNFDYEKNSKKMADWRFDNVQELRSKRCIFGDRHLLHVDYARSDYDVSELYHTAEEVEEIEEAMKMVPGKEYASGFNVDIGDKNVIWKYQAPPPFYTLRSLNSRDIKVLKEELKKLEANATV